jgi:hypothetical protein
VENGVTLGSVRRIGTSKFSAEILEKSDFGGISRAGRGRNSARCTGITNKDRSCSFCVCAGLSRSGIARSATGFVTTGDRVQLYDPEHAAVAREVVQTPAALEICFI